MRNRTFLSSIAVGLIVTLLSIDACWAADDAVDFYKGKQITLIVSTGSGGGYDGYARLLARHYGRFIPGKPNVIVQNMPGAGGIRATNFIYNSAPKDGTVIGIVHSAMTTVAVLPLAQAQFDTSKITWIGNMEKETAQCVSWHASKIKTAQDMFKNDFVVGGTGVGSNLEIYPRVINEFFGAKIKIISGYKGGDEVALALERGEVDGRCGWPMSSILTTRPDWVTDKKLNFLLQTGLDKDPALPDAPLIMDFVKNDDDRAAIELIFISRSLLRPVLGPPGIPAARTAVLRKALMEALRDPTLVKDGAPQGITITPMSGEDVEAVIARVNKTPAAVAERAVKAMGSCDTCSTE